MMRKFLLFILSLVLYGQVFTQTSDQYFTLPWYEGNSYTTCTQGNFGSYSHYSGTGAEYAFDFGLSMGANVVAARSGTIVMRRHDVPDGNCPNGGSCVSDVNYVIIDHGDGTYGQYYHLKQWSVPFYTYEKVVAGQTIGKCGKSGWATNPHLHFSVMNSAADHWEQSIQTRFKDVDDSNNMGGIPQEDAQYRAGALECMKLSAKDLSTYFYSLHWLILNWRKLGSWYYVDDPVDYYTIAVYSFNDSQWEFYNAESYQQSINLNRPNLGRGWHQMHVGAHCEAGDFHWSDHIMYYEKKWPQFSGNAATKSRQEKVEDESKKPTPVPTPSIKDVPVPGPDFFIAQEQYMEELIAKEEKQRSTTPSEKAKKAVCGGPPENIEHQHPHVYSALSSSQVFKAQFSASPNPFSDFVNIKINIPYQSQARITVFDFSGKQVAQVFDGLMAQGTHSFKWDGSTEGGHQSPAGAYTIQLMLDGNKVLLEKVVKTQ